MKEIIQLWYLLDSKGVASIVSDRVQADIAMREHKALLETTRGAAHLYNIHVLREDWDAGKVTTDNIHLRNRKELLEVDGYICTVQQFIKVNTGEGVEKITPEELDAVLRMQPGEEMIVGNVTVKSI